MKASSDPIRKALEKALHVMVKGMEVRMCDRWPALKLPLEDAIAEATAALALPTPAPLVVEFVAEASSPMQTIAELVDEETDDDMADKGIEQIVEAARIAKTTPPLVVEAGKWYRRRDGEVVGPVEKISSGPRYRWTAGGETYLSDGHWNAQKCRHSYDLIAEAAPPTVEAVAEQMEINDFFGKHFTPAPTKPQAVANYRVGNHVEFFSMPGPFAVTFTGEGAACHVMPTPHAVLDLLMHEEGAGFGIDEKREDVICWLQDGDYWNLDEGNLPFQWNFDIGEISHVSVTRVTPWHIQPTPPPTTAVESVDEWYYLQDRDEITADTEFEDPSGRWLAVPLRIVGETYISPREDRGIYHFPMRRRRTPTPAYRPFGSAELNIDITPSEEARALHRVVRAMHDGHCPQCGYLGNANEFEIKQTWERSIADHACPVCGFSITADEANAALQAFHPFMRKNFEVFSAWRVKRLGTPCGLPITNERS